MPLDFISLSDDKKTLLENNNKKSKYIRHARSMFHTKIIANIEKIWFVRVFVFYYF